jgi:hypothetical protein
MSSVRARCWQNRGLPQGKAHGRRLVYNAKKSTSHCAALVIRNLLGAIHNKRATADDRFVKQFIHTVLTELNPKNLSTMPPNQSLAANVQPTWKIFARRLHQ